MYKEGYKIMKDMHEGMYVICGEVMNAKYQLHTLIKYSKIAYFMNRSNIVLVIIFYEAILVLVQYYNEV